MKIDVALSATPALAEGAFWAWHTQELIWVDILGCTLNRFDPVTGKNRAHVLPSFVGTAVPRSDGGFQIAVRDGFARFDPHTEALTELVSPPEHDARTTRFNDGKCDPAGRFLAGTISLTGESNAAALYVLDSDGKTRRLLSDVSISNGLVWSADGRTLYYIDTPTQRIDAFDYDIATATLSNRRPAVEIPASYGYPDGMTIDAEGQLWVALWGGSAILRCDPRRGTIVQKLSLPVSLVTSCAFGGAKLDVLYVTSARCDLTTDELAAQPLAGSILALDPQATGCKSTYFQHYDPPPKNMP